MADNSRAIAALDRAIARVRELGALPEQIAPAVAREAKAQIDANIAAGRAPNGQAWEPTAEGKRPLRNAAQAVTAAPIGSRVVVSVSGPEAFHHKGKTRGNIARPILPGRRQAAVLFRRAIEAAIAKELR